MKSYKEILETCKSKVPKKKEDNSLREQYVTDSIFHIGDMVKTSDGNVAEIIDRGTNYLTLVKEGVTFKKWLKDVTPIQTEEAQKRRAQMFKESFIIKGYKTKNFTRELSEQFKDIAKAIGDTYALYNTVVCMDKLLGMTDDQLNESYDDYRIAYERTSKYFSKFNIKLDEFSRIEDQLFEYALTEGVKFSSADKMKVATIIAATSGVTPSTNAEITVNTAARKFKSGSHTPEAWKLIGAMLNKATQAGIKWDKSIFHKSTSKFMELE